MGLLPQIGQYARDGKPRQRRDGAAKGLPTVPAAQDGIGGPHDEAGHPDGAAGFLDLGRIGAVLPAIAIAARRAAPLAAMHPAAGAAPDGG